MIANFSGALPCHHTLEFPASYKTHSPTTRAPKELALITLSALRDLSPYPNVPLSSNSLL